MKQMKLEHLFTISHLKKKKKLYGQFTVHFFLLLIAGEYNPSPNVKIKNNSFLIDE